MLQYADTSYKVNKTITVSRMLSGRFKCGSLLRHFSANITGICELCEMELEDLPHILIPKCPVLQQRAAKLMNYAIETLKSCDNDKYCAAYVIFEQFMSSKDDSEKVQFVLDPSVIQEVIATEQKIPGTLNFLLSITTTWCYSLNKMRTKLLEI